MPISGNTPGTARARAPSAGLLAPTAFFLALFLAASAAHAHGGGLNKDGCHHEKKTGGYHCH